MAKWGEGDPRWIVEERPDATNVNNWHWTEKNASQWSKDKITELLLNLKIDDSSIGYCNIIEIVKCDGEASASNRKAKLFFFYEWVLELKWEGFLNGNELKFEGVITIPNLSEENQPKEVDVNVSLNPNQPEEGESLKKLLRLKGTEIIREKLKDYIDGLKKEFSQGMILPTVKKIENNNVPSQSEDSLKVTNDQNKHSGSSQKLEKHLKVSSINMTESMKCTALDFYNAFVVVELVQAFTRGPCLLEPNKGGRFELFDGNIQGTFEELVPGEKIVQKWRKKNWPSGHFSTVTLILKQEKDCTSVQLNQTEVPESEVESTTAGWKTFYWESMKRTFGFGAHLFWKTLS